MYDTIIVGTGPAGFSAAMNLKIHNKSFLWFGNKDMSSKVSKAEKIRNYPGLPEITGPGAAGTFPSACREYGHRHFR